MLLFYASFGYIMMHTQFFGCMKLKCSIYENLSFESLPTLFSQFIKLLWTNIYYIQKNIDDK
jgi:hypothetical protein